MTARPHEKGDQPEAAAAPLDPAFIERCRESLADPRPDIPAAEVRAYLKALREAPAEERGQGSGGERRKLRELVEALRSLRTPGEVEKRVPIEFPDRPGLY
jgi:hypothetical protein